MGCPCPLLLVHPLYIWKSFHTRMPQINIYPQIKSHSKFPYALDISEDLLQVLMGCVYDPTKKIPSQRSPLLLCDIYFSMSQMGFLFAERCFQLPHCNLPVMNQTLLGKFSFSQRKCAAVMLKVAETFHWLHTCHRSRLLLVTLATWSCLLFFFWQDYFLCNTSAWSHIAW